MGTIEELKRTLADHADLPDDGLPVRATSVAGRVRTVRRQRRAALAGAAAALVAMAGVLTLLPSDHDDPRVAATVVGVDVPEHLTSLGRTYAYDHKVVAESGTATVELPASDTPRLLSWATRGSDQRVQVSVPGSEDPDGFVSQKADFTDFTEVPSGTEWTVRLHGPHAPLGIAVYDLAEQADGVTRDGVTFRQQVGDRQLLAAQVGAKGQSEVSVTFTAGTGRHYVSDWCTSSWNGKGHIAAWATVEVDGEESYGGSCARQDGMPDPGATSTDSQDTATGLPARVRAGDEVTLTLRLGKGPDSHDLLADDQAQLGIAVYEGPSGRQTSVGEVPEVVEHDGHTWRLDGLQEGSVATGRPMVVTMPPGRDRFLVGFHVGDIAGSPRMQLLVDGRAGSYVQYDADGALGGSAIGGYAVPGTGSAKLVARGGSASGVIVRYELVD